MSKVKIWHWTAPDKVKTFDIKHSIYPDDTVGIVKKKIAIELGVSTSRDIHAWTERPCVPPSSCERFAKVLTEQIMGNNDALDATSVHTRIGFIFPDAGITPDYSDSVYRKQDVLKIVRRIKSNKMYSMLGHQWVTTGDKDETNTKHVLRSCNPYMNIVVDENMVSHSDTPTDAYHAVSENSIMIHTCCIEEPYVIHFVRRDELLLYMQRYQNYEENQHRWRYGFLDVYFPPGLSLASESAGMIDPNTNDISEIYIDFDDSIKHNMKMKLKSVLPTQVRVSFLHVKVHDVGDSLTTSVVATLDDAFAQFQTTTDIPVVVYKSDNDVLHKIHKPSLGYLMDNDVLQKWFGRKLMKHADNYVIFYVKYPDEHSDTYINVVFNQYMRCDVIISFHRNSFLGSVEDVLKAVRTAKPVMEYVRSKLISPDVLPDIDERHIWGDAPQGALTQLVSLNAYVIIADSNARLSPLNTFNEVCNKFFPSVLTVLSKNTINSAKGKKSHQDITLQYRKVDNFVALTEIQHFLQKNMHLNRMLQVQYLMRYFHIDLNRAQSEVDTWISKRSEVQKAFGMDNTSNLRSFVSVKLNVAPSKLRATARIHGLDSFGRLQTVCDYVGFAFMVCKSKSIQDKIFKMSKTVKSFRSNFEDNQEGIIHASSLIRDAPASSAFLDAALLENTNEGLGDTSKKSSASIADSDTDDLFLDGIIDEDDDEDGDDYTNDTKEDDGEYGSVEGNSNNTQRNSNHKADSRIQLETLSRADPLLFAAKKKGYSTYATICGKVDERQPVIINKERQDKLNPEGYTETVLYGSSPDNMHYYACPDVWCPKSKIVMTTEQFNKAGKKCPVHHDSPVLFESKYWDGHKKRYIGFLDPSKHPRGLCMPCCFKTKNKKLRKCAGARMSGSNVDDNYNVASDDNNNTDIAAKKYIKNDDHVLEEGRLALLPDALNSWLRTKSKCGARVDGSGPIIEASNCVVRMGMPLGEVQSFLNMIAVMCDINGGISAVHEKIIDKITLPSFVKLQNGAVFRLFSKQVQDMKAKIESDTDIFKTFKRHVLEKPSFYDDTTVKCIRNKGSRISTFSWEKFGDIRYAASVFRSLCTYVAYKLFLDSVANMDSHFNTHHILTDALYESFQMKLVTFEVLDQNVFIHLPNVPIENGDTFFMCCCIDNQYEPVVRVTVKRRTALIRIDYDHDANNEVLQPLVQLFRQQFDSLYSDPVCKMIHSLTTNLQDIGYETESLLLQHDSRSKHDQFASQLLVCGVLARSIDNRSIAPLLLPLPERIPLAYCMNIGWMYLDEALYQSRGRNWTPKEISDIMRDLRKITGDERFAVTHKLFSTDNKSVIAIETAHGVFPIPCDFTKLTNSPTADAFFTLGRDLAASTPPTSDSILKASMVLEIQNMMDSYMFMLFKVLEDDDDKMQELRFLHSDYNPFPLYFRQQKSRELIANVLDEKSDLIQVPEILAHEFLDRVAISLFKGIQSHQRDGISSRRMFHNVDEIVLNSTDISRLQKLGTLTRIGLISYLEHMYGEGAIQIQK